MDQALDLKVNQLPSKTWNWLHMNEASVSQALVDGENKFESAVPEGFSERIFPTGGKADFDRIPTGMGADMEKLARAAQISRRVYTAAAGKRQTEPLRLDFSYADGARQMNCIDLKIPENSHAAVVMDYASPRDAAGLAVIRTRVSAGKDSTLCLVQIERLGECFDCLNDVGIVCEENARVHVVHLVLGGRKVWQGCQAALAGKKSDFTADIGYLAEKDGRLDMNYVARHVGKQTTSEMDSCGVLKDRAFKLFRGTIDFLRGSAGAKGNEKEDVLLLDDTVVNQTIPLILCAEEDVEGNHGATIGQLDEELMFYLQSRGMPQDAIYRMMARARIDAVCRKIPDEAVRKKLEKYLDGKFGLSVSMEDGNRPATEESCGISPEISANGIPVMLEKMSAEDMQKLTSDGEAKKGGERNECNDRQGL